MKIEINSQLESCRNQFEEFIKTGKVRDSEILKFDGVGDADVYNPSVPFELNSEIIIAGRVEMRGSEASKAIFFIEKDGIWVPRSHTPVFDLQDPFAAKIGDELVFGGVRVIWEGERIISWVTDFYRGKSLNDLKLFATGPSHMKDIRLIGLPDERICIFSRPQGPKMIDKYGCIAKIGFTVVHSLEEVTAEAIANAPLLEGHFLSCEWGGCNQLHILKNGMVGAVGHKAWGEGVGDGMILHYYSMAFAIDPETRKMSQCKIIGSRDCFPEGSCKWSRVKDVTFTAGIVRNGDGRAILYAGLSDCQVGRAVIPDPFLEYEK